MILVYRLSLTFNSRCFHDVQWTADRLFYLLQNRKSIHPSGACSGRVNIIETFTLLSVCASDMTQALLKKCHKIDVLFLSANSVCLCVQQTYLCLHTYNYLFNVFFVCLGVFARCSACVNILLDIAVSCCFLQPWLMFSV